jgi:hypothetical protein
LSSSPRLHFLAETTLNLNLCTFLMTKIRTKIMFRIAESRKKILQLNFEAAEEEEKTHFLRLNTCVV